MPRKIFIFVPRKIFIFIPRKLFIFVPKIFFERQQVALFLFLSSLPSVKFKPWKKMKISVIWNDNDLEIVHDWGSGARMAPLDLQKFQLGLNSQPDLRPIPNFARVPQKRPLSPCFDFIFQRCIEFEMAFVLFYSQAVIQSVETLKAWLDAMINWALGKNLERIWNWNLALRN